MSDPRLELAISMYDQGKRVVEIERATGIGRTMLYKHLRARNKLPNRQGARRELDNTSQENAWTVNALIERLVELQRELADRDAKLHAIGSLLQDD